MCKGGVMSPPKIRGKFSLTFGEKTLHFNQIKYDHVTQICTHTFSKNERIKSEGYLPFDTST